MLQTPWLADTLVSISYIDMFSHNVANKQTNEQRKSDR